jgi:TonB family protein
MPSNLVVVLVTVSVAAAVLLPAAIIQRSGGSSGRAAPEPEPRPFPSGFAKGAYRTSPGIRAPALQHAARPRYPPEVTDPRPAVVELLAIIDEDGDVDARVLSAPDPRDPFEREALATVRKYVFEPGSIAGAPVPVVVTLLVEFRGSGAGSGVRVIGGTADPPPGIQSPLIKRATPTGPRLLRPLPVSKVYPELPPAARDLSGRVQMLAVLRADGTVGEVEIIGPLAPDIDAAAVDAVRRWVFEPAIEDGRAVPALVSAFVSVNETM